MNFEKPLILENSRIRLEPLEANHLEDLLPITLRFPNLIAFSPSPFGSKEKLQQYIEQALTAKAKHQRYPFIIYDKQSKNFIGSTSFGNYSQKDQRLEIGWTWIDKSKHGSGLNTHLKHLMLSYGFENLGIERFEFKTDERNLQSRRAIEKIGGIYEGLLRSHTLMMDGYRRNTVIYGIIKNDWKQLQKSVFKHI